MLNKGKTEALCHRKLLNAKILYDHKDFDLNKLLPTQLITNYFSQQKPSGIFSI